MPLFMFASGYVYIATKKDVSYQDFLFKKIKRLMVPYFVTSFIVISIKLLTQGNMSVDNPVTLYSFVRMFYAPEAGYFLWFIWALWWMFVIVPLFKSKQSRMVLFILSIFLHFSILELPKTFCLYQSSVMLMYFMFGVFAYDNLRLRDFMKNFDWRKIVPASFLFIVCELMVMREVSCFKIVSYLLPIIGIWVVLEISKCICRKWTGVNKGHWLMIVSSSSYIIYLFHTTFEGFTKSVLRKLPLDIDVWYIFTPEVILVVTSGVIIPILIHRYIFQRYKITQILFGLK